MTLTLREQQLMDRPLTAGQIYDECAADARCDAFVLVELQHIEQVAWMLTIERGTELSAIQILFRDHRQLHVGEQLVAGGLHE